MGVPRDWLLVCVLISPPLGGLTGYILLMFPIFFLMVAFGYLKAKEDPEFFTVYIIYFKLKPTKGDYGGREYTA